MNKFNTILAVLLFFAVITSTACLDRYLACHDFGLNWSFFHGCVMP